MSKLGLVELEGDEQAKADEDSKIDMKEIEALLAVDEGKDEPKARPRPAPPPRAPAPAPASQPRPTPPGDIVEGRAFDAYYGEAAVESSPYPAEKLLKVLDGLRQMDSATRYAAVTAMDAADDTWSIADVVLDAQRKQRVLEDAKASLEQQAGNVRAECEQNMQRLDEYLQQATKTIRDKIAQLEAQLQKESADVATQKAGLISRIETAREAAKREQQRLHNEIQRFNEITNTFVVDRQKAG